MGPWDHGITWDPVPFVDCELLVWNASWGVGVLTEFIKRFYIGVETRLARADISKSVPEKNGTHLERLIDTDTWGF